MTTRMMINTTILLMMMIELYLTVYDSGYVKYFVIVGSIIKFI